MHDIQQLYVITINYIRAFNTALKEYVPVIISIFIKPKIDNNNNNIIIYRNGSCLTWLATS